MSLTAAEAPVADHKYALRYYKLITNVDGFICRHILENECMNGLANKLDANRSCIEDCYYGTNNNKKILKEEQFTKLFPGGRAATSAEKFDITLLMFLLSELVFNDTRVRAIWRLKFADIYQSNKSTVADLVRIRGYRNMLHDIIETKTSISETDFCTYWEDLTKVFLRLGETYDIRGVYQRIDKELHDPLDGIRENELERQIQEVRVDLKEAKDMDKKTFEMLQTMDVGQIEIADQLKDINRKLSQTAVNKEYMQVVLADEYFVQTEQYVKIRQALLVQKIIVLNGAPGEGKTTMAKKLVTEVSKGKCIKMTSYEDWETFDKTGADAVLIDDMFGAGIFDKEGCRKWQKLLQSIAKWVNDCKENTRYVVITSRTYILKEARKKMFLDNLFTEENIHPLLSSKLLASEKLSILQNHFKISEKPFPGTLQVNPNKKKRKRINTLKEKHDSLLKDISETKIDVPGPAFTIGFPECARLFASNEQLYSEGVRFFKEPMTHILKGISEICRKDDVFIAFFVLWAQKSRTLRARNLEYSVQETSLDITDPILKLQFSPQDHLRKIREELYNHVHDAGFITLDQEEQFRFSHYVVRDAVGIISFERNPTATILFSDTEFISTYIRIPPKSPNLNMTTQAENLSKVEILLCKSRFVQISERIAKLLMGSTLTESLGDDQNSNFLEHSIFKNDLFQNEEFCTSFIETNRTAGNLETLLKTPLRRLDKEFLQYKFVDLEKVNTKLRIPSFLLWYNEKVTLLAELCFSEMANNLTELYEQELFIALLIASSIGSYEMAEFLVNIGGQINSQMILIAYVNIEKRCSITGQDKASQLQSGEEKLINCLRSNAKLPDSDGFHPIHLAALEGCLDLVTAILHEDQSQAEIRFSSKERSERSGISGLKGASLYHIAAFKNNKDLVELLKIERVSANALDNEQRTPLLYAIYTGKSRIAPILLDVAKSSRNEMYPDSTGNTPLHIAIEKSVKQKQETSRKVFTDISLRLCRESKENLHLKNSDDKSPLHIACHFQATEIVQEIFKREPDICRKEPTLLHEFVREDNISAIELLLSFGFDHSLIDQENRTPLQLAEELKQMNIANLLREQSTDSEATPRPSSPEQNIEHSTIDEK